MTLSAGDFVTFFRSVHGHRPFDWQQRLVARVLDDGWPQVIDVPTGLGKTAVVDVGVFALAAQARLPADERTAPTRTFVVVNRRVIVDQTHERAKLLQAKLDKPDNEILIEVAERLRALTVGEAPKRALQVVRMRGGVSWSWRWLASPNQPAVVTGTVDQYGSRLLFRGYGVGNNLRPIDAALTGTDRLLILDEAHLSWPFIETAETVDAHEQRAEAPVLPLRRPAPVLLSATPPLDLSRPREVFRFDPVSETSEIAQQRYTAQRLVRLVELRSAESKVDTDSELANGLVRLAARLVREVPRVAVVCNTVSLARRVFTLVEEQLTGQADVALLIGRCRGIDRERINETWIRRLSADRRNSDERPLVVVATQTIEVGADVDIDALVTEAAPLDALLQRLGRLDRRGSRGSSHAFVVHAPHRHSQDAVYGGATVRTWTWLSEQACSPKPAALATLDFAAQRAPSLEMGPMQLSGMLDPATRSALASEPPLAPVALIPTLDGWARTNPQPDPDQPVAPFLHGFNRGQAEVLVCWRAGLPELREHGALEAWTLELRSAPVGTHETVSVPIAEARQFLAGMPVEAGADIEGQRPADPREVTESHIAVAQAPDGAVRVADARDIRPGDLLVLDAKAGGHDSWGWTGQWEDNLVADVGDLESRCRRLRLRAEVIAGLLGVERSAIPIPAPDELDVDLGAVLDCIGDMAGSAAESDSTTADHARYLGRVCEAITERRPRDTVIGSPDQPYRWRLVSGTRAVSPLPEAVGDGDGDEDGEVAGSSSGSRPVDLNEHLCDVETRASQFAQQLGLSVAAIRAEALAGLAHDLGKVDPRFQAMLYGGDRLRAEATGRKLAKSGMDPTDRDAFRRARQRAGLPAGLRHEAQSAALLAVLLDSAPELGEGLDVELVHHLVTSHHGRGRPLLPGVTDPNPLELRAEVPGTAASVSTPSDSLLVDWTGPARFRRLGARYGWWGLALLETVLRLADIAVSEEYAAQEDE